KGGRDLQSGLAEGRENLRNNAPPVAKQIGQLALGVGSSGTGFMSGPAGIGELGDSLQQAGAAQTTKNIATGLVDHALSNPLEFVGELSAPSALGKAALGSKSSRVT